jgi:hypothetical protein
MATTPEKHRKRRKVNNTPYHAHFLTFEHACGAGMAPNAAN